MQTCTCGHDKTEHRFGIDHCMRCGCTQFKLQESKHDDDDTTIQQPISQDQSVGVDIQEADTGIDSDSDSFSGGGGESGGGGASSDF